MIVEVAEGNVAVVRKSKERIDEVPCLVCGESRKRGYLVLGSWRLSVMLSSVHVCVAASGG